MMAMMIVLTMTMMIIITMAMGMKSIMVQRSSDGSKIVSRRLSEPPRGLRNRLPEGLGGVLGASKIVSRRVLEASWGLLGPKRPQDTKKQRK